MDTLWHCKCEHGKDFIATSDEVYFVTPCATCEGRLGRLNEDQKARVAARIAQTSRANWDQDTQVEILAPLAA